MATALKNKTQSTLRVKSKTTIEYQEPKRLSKVGQWMRDNPGGIIIVKDRRAVNK